MDEVFYQRVLDTMSDGVYFVDRARRITYWSAGAERLTGYRADEVVGRRCADGLLGHVDAAGTALCQTGCPLLATMQDGQRRDCHMYFQHRDGHRHPVHVRAAPLVNDEGQVIGAVETFSDDSLVSVLRERLDEARRATDVDPLTGAGNRRLLDVELEMRLHAWRSVSRRFGLMFVDIDHFKQVNDTWGHDTGDQLLQMVAQTLTHVGRGSDSVARYGGEEFVIVTTVADENELYAAAERRRLLVGRSTREANGTRVGVTVSIGAALVASGDTAASLLRRADRMLYQAKRNGRDRVVVETSPPEPTAAHQAPPVTLTSPDLSLERGDRVSDLTVPR